MTCDTWHVTCDTWHVTCYTWHMTSDMWHVGGGANILSKFQLPSSYCLWFMILWRSGGEGWRSDRMNDEAVYRTAPATPGLLKISQGGPLITDPPPTSFTILSKRKKCDIWHVICDKWHVTNDTRNMTRDMWYLTHDMWGEVNLLSKYQLPSTCGVGVKVFLRYYHKGWLTESVN